MEKRWASSQKARRNLDAAGINHRASISRMTPRNESIRRSITAGAGVPRNTEALSLNPINIPYRHDNNLLLCSTFGCCTRSCGNTHEKKYVHIASILHFRVRRDRKINGEDLAARSPAVVTSLRRNRFRLLVTLVRQSSWKTHIPETAEEREPVISSSTQQCSADERRFTSARLLTVHDDR